MTRSLYRSLLWLHPPAFRRQFAGEMLWIFDEAAADDGPAPLLFDVLVSLLRQWVIGCGAWKVAAGMAGAALQLILVTPLAVVGPGGVEHGRNLLPKSLANGDIQFSWGLLSLVLILVLSTALLTFLGRSGNRRRI